MIEWLFVGREFFLLENKNILILYCGDGYNFMSKLRNIELCILNGELCVMWIVLIKFFKILKKIRGYKWK